MWWECNHITSHVYLYNYTDSVTRCNANQTGNMGRRWMQVDSLTTEWCIRLNDRRILRHCFIFCLVRAGGSRCNPLPNVHPARQKDDIYHMDCGAKLKLTAASLQGQWLRLFGLLESPTNSDIVRLDQINQGKGIPLDSMCNITVAWPNYNNVSDSQLHLKIASSWSHTYPMPRAKMCEMRREGIKTLRNSAEKMPPFFMTPLFLILRDTERLGCLKWNSLRRE